MTTSFREQSWMKMYPSPPLASKWCFCFCAPAYLGCSSAILCGITLKIKSMKLSVFKVQQTNLKDSSISKHNCSGGEGLSIRDILASWCCSNLEQLGVVSSDNSMYRDGGKAFTVIQWLSLKCNGEVLVPVFREIGVAREENKSIHHIHPIYFSAMDKETHVNRSCCDLLWVRDLQLAWWKCLLNDIYCPLNHGEMLTYTKITRNSTVRVCGWLAAFK